MKLFCFLLVGLALAQPVGKPTLIAYDSFSSRHDRQGQLEGAWRLSALLKVVGDFSRNRKGYVARDLPEKEEIDLQAILDVHAREYLERIQSEGRKRGYLCDGRWCPYVDPDSYLVAARASTLAVKAVRSVHSGEFSNAFALTRPPGHHARSSSGDGFCLLNHAAIAARYLVNRLGYERVAIVDLDAHHGDGTESIAQKDPRILYASLHQSPAWPFSGDQETPLGAKDSKKIFNFPIQPGTSGSIALRKTMDKILSVLEPFAPQFIVVSAGYDLHRRDPLGALDFSGAEIADAHRTLIEFAKKKAAGRIVFLLEGGYNREALSEGVASTLLALRERNENAREKAR